MGTSIIKLEKAKTVQAQCFAAIIVRDYFNKHVLELKEAQKKLNFNLSLLDRVSDVMSTKINKITPDNLISMLKAIRRQK